MQQVAFLTVVTTGIPRFRSCPLNVRKDETEIISFTLNVKSDVCLFFIKMIIIINIINPFFIILKYNFILGF